MEKKGFKNRREAGKNPATGRSAGRGEGSISRGGAKSTGVKRGGVDLKTLDQLATAGLLSSEGKRLKESMAGGAGEMPPRGRREATGEGPGARREFGAGPKTGPRPNREAGAERPKLRRAAAPAFVKAGRPVGPQEPERLHKVMAQAGLASRRHSEELIQAGRVTVNGQVVTQLGMKVTPGKDLVEVDGRLLGKAEEQIYILLNKPKGYVTTLFDPQGRKKVTDLLGGEIGQRVYPVGRLDYDTEGLLLLTNDGQLANALMHPSQQINKTYIAKVRGVPNTSKITMLEKGVELEDGLTAPADVKLIEAHGPNAASLSIRIHEGRNRQVRRMFEYVGHEVISLRRTTMGPLHIKTLKVGEWRHLTPQELKDLRTAIGDKEAARAAYVADMAAMRAKGRPVFGAKGDEGTEGVAPRFRTAHAGTKPVLGGTRPVTEGTKPVLGRPARSGSDQEYGTKPFTRPARPAAPARFDREDGAKSFGRPTREDGPKPSFRGPATEGGPKPFGGPAREGGAKPFGRPTREGGGARFDRQDGAKPLGRPTREGGPNSFGGPTREGGPARFDREGGTKSFGRPTREEGSKSFGGPNREGGTKSFGRPTREEGSKSFGGPTREGGTKSFGRPTREGGAKPYARPARNFTPRPDEGGPRPTGPRRRP
ncbi:MAG TPA: pseudouridine synthase [Symbiobacteriaceae bacterium]|nr:pseudouridine synthase [Symbiobacteriaceae bacterium]